MTGSINKIYFAREAGTVGPIKIGCSCGPEARLKQIEFDYRIKIELIAVFVGDFTVERNLHLKFDHLRAPWQEAKGGSTEWFEAAPELLTYIEDCQATGQIVLSDEECRERIWADRYLAGETLKQIGDDYGVSRERVRQVLRKHNIPSLGHRKEHSRKVVPVDLEAQIIALGRKGFNQKQIAAELDVPRPYISLYLRKNGISAPRSPHPIREDVRERSAKIAADYQAGMKQVDLKAKYGVDPSEVYRALRLMGVEKRGHPNAGTVSNNAVQAYCEGKSLGEIAKLSGCAVITVKRHLERNGIKPRGRLEQLRITKRKQAA